MAKIRIQNLGPITDSGLIDLTEVMLIIGRQSSGKSTFMKVLCQCRWLEKNLMTSPFGIDEDGEGRQFVAELKQFHRINELYFRDSTIVEYEGDIVKIVLKGSAPRWRFLTRKIVGNIVTIPS